MTLSDPERPDARNQIFLVDLNNAGLGQPRHCICSNASRGLSATAEFLVLYFYCKILRDQLRY